jgi:hypothetical protein
VQWGKGSEQGTRTPEALMRRRTQLFEAREAAQWSCDVRGGPSTHVYRAMGDALAAVSRLTFAAGTLMDALPRSVRTGGVGAPVPVADGSISATDALPRLSAERRSGSHGRERDGRRRDDANADNANNQHSGDDGLDDDDGDDFFDEAAPEVDWFANGVTSGPTSGPTPAGAAGIAPAGMLQPRPDVAGAFSGSTTHRTGLVPAEWSELAGVPLPSELRLEVWRAAYGARGDAIAPASRAAQLDDTFASTLVHRVLRHGVAGSCLARDTLLGDPEATHAVGGANAANAANAAESHDRYTEDPAVRHILGGWGHRSAASGADGTAELQRLAEMYRWERGVAARVASMACAALGGGFSSRIVALACLAVAAHRPVDAADAAVTFRARVSATDATAVPKHPFRDAWRRAREDPIGHARALVPMVLGMAVTLPSGEAALAMARAVVADVAELDPNLGHALEMVPADGPASRFKAWEGAGIAAVVAAWIECGFAGRLRPEASRYALDACAVIGPHALADIAVAVLLVSANSIVRARNLHAASASADSDAEFDRIGTLVGAAVCAAPPSLLTAEVVRAHCALVHGAIGALGADEVRALVVGDCSSGRPSPDGMMGTVGLAAIIERSRRLATKRAIFLENRTRNRAEDRARRVLAERGFDV